MNSFRVGWTDGFKDLRKDRIRRYQTQKVEDDYWRGYIQGVKDANHGKMIVRCEREGKIFATHSSETITCPACGREYVRNFANQWEADRLLTILSKGA